MGRRTGDMNIVAQILEFLTAGMAAYRRKQKQRALEKQIDDLERRYHLTRAHYAASQLTVSEYREKLDSIIADYSELRKKYGDLLQSEFMSRIHADKRDLDDNPY